MSTNNELKSINPKYYFADDEYFNKRNGVKLFRYVYRCTNCL